MKPIKLLTLSLLLLLGTMNGWAQKTVVWEKPLSTFSRISERFNISKVEFCDTATVLTFHFQFSSGM